MSHATAPAPIDLETASREDLVAEVSRLNDTVKHLNGCLELLRKEGGIAAELDRLQEIKEKLLEHHGHSAETVYVECREEEDGRFRFLVTSSIRDSVTELDLVQRAMKHCMAFNYKIWQEKAEVGFFADYEELSQRTGKGIPDLNTGNLAEVSYLTLGLVGEAGEIANKVKKLYRDAGLSWADPVPEDKLPVLVDELGDVFWYANRLSRAIGSHPILVMNANMAKIADRLERGTLQGSGDGR